MIIRLGISIFMLLDSRLNTGVPEPNGSNHSSNLTFSESPHEFKHDLLYLFSKYFNFATLSEKLLASFVFIMSFCPKLS
jgi:hypothetical protein